MDRLLRISPLCAATAVNSLFLVILVVQGYASSPLVIVGANAIFAVVLLGWPVMLIIGLSGKDQSATWLIRVAFIGAIAFHALVVPLLVVVGSEQVAVDTLGMILGIPLGLLGPLYIMWSAARFLVTYEENAAVSWDRYIGTFLLFLQLFCLAGQSC